MNAPLGIAQLFASLDETQRAAVLASLSPAELRAVLDDWSLWALPHQRIPDGNWRRWILLAGRGSGKDFCASKTIHDIARKGRKLIRTGEIGIIGRTHTDVRAVSIEGPSGILATAPKNFKPAWYTGNGLIVWPNGIRASVFSGDSPESIRGHNFAFVWADEMAVWPDAENTWWTIIEPALRLGWARALITTTPRPLPWLKKILSLSDSVVTRATTYDNPYLAESAIQAFRQHYEGTRIGRQEIYGEIIEDTAGALWRFEWIERDRVSPTAPKPDFKRIVIAVDPAVTNTEDSDETGIIVYAVDLQGHGYVLEDASGRYSPTEWANKVHALYNRYKADRVVAEVNQGGDMVEQVLRAVAPKISYQSVRATRGKQLRAEPVSALYERGQVHHVGVYPKLESQLCDWVPGSSSKSPDRLDALVYASIFTQLSDKVAGPISSYY